MVGRQINALSHKCVKRVLITQSIYRSYHSVYLHSSECRRNNRNIFRLEGDEIWNMQLRCQLPQNRVSERVTKDVLLSTFAYFFPNKIVENRGNIKRTLSRRKKIVIPKNLGTIIIVFLWSFDETESIDITDVRFTICSQHIKSAHSLLKIIDTPLTLHKVYMYNFISMNLCNLLEKILLWTPGKHF